MSDDIRVYWDKNLRLYSICIGGLVITQSMMMDDIVPHQCLCDIDEIALAGDELVYDTAEDSAEERVNDDIRVYWDGLTDFYYVMVGEAMIAINDDDEVEILGIWEAVFVMANLELVHDTTNDTAWIKLIDENLVVPDLSDICISLDSGLRIKDGAFRMQERNPWCTNDTYNMAVAHSNQKAYHEERMA